MLKSPRQAAFAPRSVPALSRPSIYTMAPGKRSASEPATAPEPKKPHPAPSASDQSKDSSAEIESGIVLRRYYPPEMTNARADDYKNGKIERPIETLEKALEETQTRREAIPPGRAVVHWFKRDTRTMDNHALHLASETAQKHNLPLIALYLVSPQDFEAHLTAPVRVDFILRNLQVLKQDLADLDIPLCVETVEKRRTLPSRLIELCRGWGAKHVYCNTEYEVDELRREAALARACLDQGISFNVVPDTCVVRPGKLTSGTGGQISIYSPWHRKWCAYLNQHPEDLDPFPPPCKNPVNTRKMYAEMFEAKIPAAPKSKSLSQEEKKKFHVMWPAGEHEAQERLKKFLSERVGNYHNTRNSPAANGTSVLSPHLAAGTISARTLVREARQAAPQKKLTDDRKQGPSMWMGEVAWRDFYKHVLCHWPYVW